MRDWLQLNYNGSRESPTWVDLWTTGTAVDYAIARARSDDEVMRLLATDEFLEMSLRRLSAFVYERRSGDKVGAAHMLAVVPPGTSTDVAPSWLVSEATAHSQSEYKRSIAVAGLNKAAPGGQAKPSAPKGGKEKGDGKGGRGGKRGRGRGAPQA